MKMLHFCFCQILTHNTGSQGRNSRHRNKRKVALSFHNDGEKIRQWCFEKKDCSAGEFLLMKECQCAASSDVRPLHPSIAATAHCGMLFMNCVLSYPIE